MTCKSLKAQLLCCTTLTTTQSTPERTKKNESLEQPFFLCLVKLPSLLVCSPVDSNSLLFPCLGKNGICLEIGYVVVFS